MLSKLHFECPEEQLQGKIASEKIQNFFCQFRILSWPFSADCRKFFGKVVRTALYVSRGRFYWEVSLTFYLLKTNVDVSKKFSLGFQSCVLNVQRNNLKETLCIQKKNLSNLHHLRTLGRKNFGIWHKLPAKIVEIAFYASSGKLKEKPVLKKTAFLFSFSNSERFFWRKIVGRVYHNYFLNVRRNISRKWMFLKNSCFFYHFRTLVENLSAFCLKLPERIVKMLPVCPEENFWKKLLQLLVCFFWFRLLAKKSNL